MKRYLHLKCVTKLRLLYRGYYYIVSFIKQVLFNGEHVGLGVFVVHRYMTKVPRYVRLLRLLAILVTILRLPSK